MSQKPNKKFFVDINLQGNQLNNATIGSNYSSDAGAFRYDSGAQRLQYSDGGTIQSVANLADIAAVTGGLIFQGGYDASTNTPDITGGTALKGYFWVVETAGSFLGESVQVGDSLIAKVDNAGANLSDWLILQGNVVIATDSVDGIVRLGTQTEVNDGTEGGAVVVTPATLQGKIDSQVNPYADSVAATAQSNAEAYADSLAPNYDPAGAAATAQSNAYAYTDAQFFTTTKADIDWVTIDGELTLIITHNIGTSTPKVACYVDNELSEFSINIVDSNTIRLKSNIAAPASVSVGVSK